MKTELGWQGDKQWRHIIHGHGGETESGHGDTARKRGGWARNHQWQEESWRGNRRWEKGREKKFNVSQILWKVWHSLFICSQLLHSFLFHKVETHKIKALGFLLEFLKGKSFIFLKKKTHQNLFNQYFRLQLNLEFKKSRFTCTFLQGIQVEFNSQRSLVAVTPAFYFILVPKCRL